MRSLWRRRASVFQFLSILLWTVMSNCRLFPVQAKEQGLAANPEKQRKRSGTGIPRKNCRSLVEPRGFRRKVARVWRRRRRSPVMAYRMMVASSMSYYEFHKRPFLDDNTTGFSLTLDGRSNSKVGNWRVRGVEWSKSILEQGSVISQFISRYGTRNVTWTNQSYDPSLVIGNKSSVPTDDGPYFKLTKRKQTTRKSRSYYSKHRVTFQYEFFDWYEKGVAGVKFHDTDVLVSTMGDGSLIVAFAGTSSPADAITNIQTFEPASHSGFYQGATSSTTETKRGGGKKNSSSTVQGSLHRGFLNALIRVDRGSVLRLCPESNPHCDSHHCRTITYLQPLHDYFGNCTMPEETMPEESKRGSSNKNADQFSSSAQEDTDATGTAADETATNPENLSKPGSSSTLSLRRRRKGGCKAKGMSLLWILQEVTTAALKEGRVVHLTGHSLGGSLASHMALDLVINHPHIPVNNLHLWTFGAPQIADTKFVTSAIQLAPRLKPFVTGRNGRYDRYVTVADDCRPDVVSEVTRLSLPSHLPPQGFHARIARTLGGVHSPIVHLVAEPHFLLTPHQFYNITVPASSSAPKTTTSAHHGGAQAKDETVRLPLNPNQSLPANPSTGNVATKQSRMTPTSTTAALKRQPPPLTSPTKTHSTVAAHATVNYLQGISRESKYHPLQSDLPEYVRAWIGET